MEKFTNGEWLIHQSPSHVVIESEFGAHICNREIYKSTVIEQMANAHLIASAPEMYAMLKLISDLSLITDDKGLSDEIDNLLAKARGE